jgi:hypothetical protein
MLQIKVSSVIISETFIRDVFIKLVWELLKLS